MSHTIVVGAGYAGVAAANRLAARGNRVSLVTPYPYFVERIRLHRVAADLREHARVPLVELIHPKVAIVIDPATRIDTETPDRVSVELASGRVLHADFLIYAVGSGEPRATGAHQITNEAQALAFRDELRGRPDAPVTVIGAGLTGVELAAVLAVSGRTVEVITSSSMDATASDRAHLGRLSRLGVTVRTGERADLKTIGADRTRLVVETAGFSVPTLAADSGLPTTADGRLVIDATLRVPGHAAIFGAGDAVCIDDERTTHLRPACATALPMGSHAANIVAAVDDGRAPDRFVHGYVMQFVDYGGRSGRAQLVRPDDSERRFAVGGWLGGVIKEAICRMTLVWMRGERRGRSVPRYPEPAPVPAEV